MGGMSPEREVSFMSGKAILQALLERGYQALPVEGDEILPGGFGKRKSKWLLSASMVLWGGRVGSRPPGDDADSLHRLGDPGQRPGHEQGHLPPGFSAKRPARSRSIFLAEPRIQGSPK